MKVEIGNYRHYKGGYYEVIGTGRDTENLEDVVIYRSEKGAHGLWVRPMKMFLETVVVEGREIPRFKREEEYE